MPLADTAPVIQVNLSEFYALLDDPRNLILIGCLAVGYLVRTIPRVNNAYVPLVVTCYALACSASTLTDLPMPRRIQDGLIYAALSIFSYELLLKHVENWIRAKFGFSQDAKDLGDIAKQTINNTPPQKP